MLTSSATTDTNSSVNASEACETKPPRQVVNHDYHDHFDSEDADAVLHDARRKRRGPRGGVAVPFPERLFTLLKECDDNGSAHIISWQSHGRCFIVRKPKLFVEHILPKYFNQTKMTSFQRQLNLYGFVRLTKGLDRGAYYHELFLRGRPNLCKHMVRTRIKGTGSKAAASPATEPDFYTMRFCYEKGDEPPEDKVCKNQAPTVSPDVISSLTADPVAPTNVVDHSGMTADAVVSDDSAAASPSASGKTEDTTSMLAEYKHSIDDMEVVHQISPVPSKNAFEEFEALLPPPPLALAPFSFAVNTGGEPVSASEEIKAHPVWVSPHLGSSVPPLLTHTALEIPLLPTLVEPQSVISMIAMDTPSVVSEEDELMEFMGDILFDETGRASL